MKVKLISFVALAFLSTPLSIFAETIILKSGRTVQGAITERSTDSLKLVIGGVPITYYLDDIESIDGAAPSNKNEEVARSSVTTDSLSSDSIDRAHIRKILKHLGYPEKTWPAIEKELVSLLTRIEFSKLYIEAAQVKSNPEQLKSFIARMADLLARSGCRNVDELLISGHDDKDIFKLMESSRINSDEKQKDLDVLVSCTAVSQLSSIILTLLDIKTYAVFSPDHAFNYLPLDGDRVMFIDIFNRSFEIFDINQYYKPEGMFKVLKEEYRLSKEESKKIRVQWENNNRPSALNEIFYALSYDKIYLSDDYAFTAAIYGNLGQMYSKYGDLEQALISYTKSHQIDPRRPNALNNRGLIYYNQGKFDLAIMDFNDSIASDTNGAIAYYNRGNAYFKKGNSDKALDDYSRAIEIDSNIPVVYYNRALLYFYTDKKNYDKSWSDVHKAQLLGYNVDHDFIESLKKASGRDR